MIGVVLGITYERGLQVVVTLLSSGEIMAHRTADITFAIPNFIDEETTARCGFLDNSVDMAEDQLAARLEILKRVMGLQKALDVDSHEIAFRVERALQELHPQQSSAWLTISAVEVATHISGGKTPSAVTLLGVNRHLMGQYRQYVAPGSSFIYSQTFLIRPKEMVDNLIYVEGLVARRDPRIDAFLEKARQILASKPPCPSSASSALTVVPHPTISFNDDDQAIIQFMKNFLRVKRSIQADPHRSSVYTMLRWLELYPDRVLNDDVVHKFLIEIGALSPWTELRKLGAEVEGKPVTNPTPDDTIKVPLCPAPDEFYPQDIVAHLRHDFGDLPVYVIDDVTAQELDDGVSVERDTETDGAFWVHVHIADPTSLIHPLHTFSKRAKAMGSTSYLTSSTDPMLPPSMVHHGISLGSGSDQQKTLTFSFKVLDSGEVLDYAVRPGIVRNVQVMTYQDVNKVLGFPSETVQYPFGLPSHLVVPHKPRSFDSRQIEDLRALEEVRRRLAAWSLQQDVFMSTTDVVTISMENTVLPEITDHSRPHFFYGDLPLVYGVDPGSSTRAQRIVAEAMKMACRVASRFLRDREIPGLRRSLVPPATRDQAAMQKLLAKRNEFGEVDVVELFRSKVNMSAARYTPSLDGHWSMGIPDGEGYVRVTSPLRRYVDLLHHWQIKYALLETPEPCFSRDWLCAYAPELELTEKYHRDYSRRDSTFWALKYIEQFMRNPRLIDGRNPLEEIEFLTASTARLEATSGIYRVPGKVSMLGLKAILLGVSQNTDSGEIFKARLHDIQLGSTPALLLKPI